MIGQHLLLKAVSLAVVTPFFSVSLIESVQSDIASESPVQIEIEILELFFSVLSWKWLLLSILFTLFK